MNKLITTDNGGFPFQLDDLRFVDDSVRNVLKGIMSAYGIAADESFILSGSGSTLNGGNYDIATGYISLDGEILEVEAHSITTTLAPGEFHVWKLKTANDPAGLKTFESTISFDTYEVRQAEVVVETPVGVYMPMIAPSIHSRMAATGFGTILQTLVLPIGDWNMDADASKLVAHGLSDYTKIRSIEAVIIDDNSTLISPLNKFTTSNNNSEGGVGDSTSLLIVLVRKSSGIFDDVLYDSTSFNRGYITIQYEL